MPSRPARFSLICFAALLLTSCGVSVPTEPEPQPQPAAVATVSVLPDTASLHPGQSVAFTASTLDAAGAVLNGPTVTWATGDPSVATVSNAGVVSAVAAGTTTVQATSESITGQAVVVVTERPVDVVSILPGDTVLQLADTSTFEVALFDQTGAALTGRVVRWSIADTTVAAVDSVTSLVTALTAGVTSLVATSESVADTAEITVIDNSIPTGFSRVWRADAVDTDWANTANWLPAALPVDSDTVLIRSGPNQPVLAGATTLSGLKLAPTASLDLGGHRLTMDGTLVADSAVISGAGDVLLSGTGLVTGTLASVRVTGFYALAGTTSVLSDATIAAGRLTPRGEELRIAGNLSVQGSGVIAMTNPGDVVDVRGDALFDGYSTDGLLTNGTLRIGGHLTQSFSASFLSFRASGEHRTVFDGADPQLLSFGSSAHDRSRFAHLVVEGAGGVVLGALIRVTGDVDVTGVGIVGAGGLRIDGGITSEAGTHVGPSNIDIAGVLDIDGTFSPGTTTFRGPDQLIPAALSYQDIVVKSTAHLTGATIVAGDLVMNSVGRLVVGPHRIEVTGKLETTSLGALVMADPASEVVVTGDARFDGTSTEGLLTDGTLWVGGRFGQGFTSSFLSFKATGSHQVIFDGPGVQIVELGSPASDRSHFNDVRVVGAGIFITGRVRVNGDFTVVQPGSVSGGGTLHVGGDLWGLSNTNIIPTHVEVGGDLLVTGTFLPDTATFFGSSGTIPSGHDYQNVIVRATRSLGGSVSVAEDVRVTSSGRLEIGAHTLEIGQDLDVSGLGALVMSDPSSEVNVARHASFNGRASDGMLTDGVLRVGGDFTQAFSASFLSFKASGAHRTELNGTSPQTVSISSSALDRSHFHHLAILGDDVRFTTITFLTGDWSVNTAVDVTGPGWVHVLGDINTVAGSHVAPTRVNVGGELVAGGRFRPQTTEFMAGASEIPAGLEYQSIVVTGNLALTGLTAATSDVSVTGTGRLDIGRHSLSVARDFEVTVNGVLEMTDPAGELDLEGDATFNGLSTDRQLTAGTLRIAGDFRQFFGASFLSFRAAGTHRTILDGTRQQTVSFSSPAPDRSFFNDLTIEGTDVRFTGGVRALGNVVLDGALLVQAGVTFDIVANLTMQSGSKLQNDGTINVLGTCRDNGTTLTGTGRGNVGCVQP